MGGVTKASLVAGATAASAMVAFADSITVPYSALGTITFALLWLGTLVGTIASQRVQIGGLRRELQKDRDDFSSVTATLTSTQAEIARDLRTIASQLGAMEAVSETFTHRMDRVEDRVDELAKQQVKGPGH